MCCRLTCRPRERQALPTAARRGRACLFAVNKSNRMNRLTDFPNRFPPAPPDMDPTELALRFLEADPTYAGADALKQRLAHTLRHAPLTPDQRNRTAALLLRALRHGSDTMFRAYAT